MLIRDLEIKTGLDRATIRYYEKEGLITPERSENGYRNYTEDNLNHLLKIKLLRQLGMSLDRIHALQQGSADLQTALTEQIQALDRRIKDTEQAKAVCLQMKSDRVSYGNLDVTHYLNALNTPQTVSVPKTFQERVSRPYHPFRRFLARWLDYTLVGNLIQFLLIVLLKVRLDTLPQSKVQYKTAPEISLRGSAVICRVGRSTTEMSYSAIFLNSSKTN